MWRALCRYFDEPHLRVLFARYATYCGSDPFLAPATLNVIPHVELGFGLHTVEGGMYRLAEALAALARERGVAVRLDADVERVELDERERRAVAVHIGGERLEADAVICNGDVAQLPHRLLAGTRWAATHLAAFDALPPSLSAFVHLAVARSGDSRLRHHNVFFSDDYPREFEALTARHEAPDSPTVYLCAPDHAEVGSQRWFFLSNAAAVPAGDLAPSVESWGAEATRCRARLGVVLAHHGLALDGNVLAEQSVTPADFAGLFPSSRGSLYGAASNSRTSAFKRPPNRVRGLANLYCVGGSTHPGAGVPMVALSARITAGLIDRSL
jgi:phytoene desaturase